MNSIKESALETFRIEAHAVARLAELLNGDFEKAVESILQSKGRVVVCGMGKSGLIGKKIAAIIGHHVAGRGGFDRADIDQFLAPEQFRREHIRLLERKGFVANHVGVYPPSPLFQQ